MSNKDKAVSRTPSKLIINVNIAKETLSRTEMNALTRIVEKLSERDARRN